MAKNTKHVVKLRRRRKGRTNYRKRIKLLSSGLPRLVIRKSLKNILAQIVEFGEKGDKIIVSASSKELEKLGWRISRSNIPSAYLTGLIIGKKATKKGVGEVIVDLGFNNKSERVYALVKGAIDSELNIRCSKEILPDDDVVSGKRISEYAKKLKETDKERYNKQFSNYLKNNINPEDIHKIFEEVKNKIKE